MLIARITAVLALALCLALVSDSAQSQQPSPSSREGVQPPPPQAAEGAQHSATDQRGTEQSPLIIKALPTDEEKNKAAADAKREDQKAANDERLARFTENLFYATVALSVIAVFQLFVFGWQAIQLKRTVQAAKEASELGNKEFIATHRPKLIVCGLDFVGGADDEKPLYVSFRYVNAGDSVAKIKTIGTKLIHDPKPSIASGLEFRDQTITPPIEVESGRHGFRLTVDTLDTPDYIFSDATEAKTLICVGYIVYTDGNGADRQMGFCRRYDSSGNRWLAVEDPEYEYSY
jgi:hypothetical protein